MIEQPTVSIDIPMTTLLEAFGANLEFRRPLAPLTSYQTGGPARYFISAESSDELVRAVKGAKRLKIPFFLMGSGSNLLVSDQGFNGLVIRVDIKKLKVVDQNFIECGAGEDLMALVGFATDNALTGLEFAAGIWGTVGGAIYGNAGAYGGDMASIVESVTLLDHDGELRTETPDYCGFEYRHSRLKETREVVVSARFKLALGDKDTIDQRVLEILASRNQKHPESLTAGCFFKNIPDASQPHGKLPAGRLLEDSGAKKLAVGGARVFDKHANIIVNSGNATSKDIRILADKMKKLVLDRFKIELEEEVQMLGDFPRENTPID